MSSETGRIEAFSDGVYAIAITLLILDLKVPMTQDGHSAWRYCGSGRLILPS